MSIAADMQVFVVTLQQAASAFDQAEEFSAITAG